MPHSLAQFWMVRRHTLDGMCPDCQNDLPQKALAWQDGSGQLWLGYNDPAYFVHRDEATQCPAVSTLQKALAALL
jgi:hypothetical protein